MHAMASGILSTEWTKEHGKGGLEQIRIECGRADWIVDHEALSRRPTLLFPDLPFLP